MASSESFMKFIADQCAGAGEITYRKMFGEYGVYCGGKLFGTVEDDRFYVKPTNAGQALVPCAPIAEPHKGAHYLLIEQVEDTELLAKLICATCAELPEKKEKKAAPKKPKA